MTNTYVIILWAIVIIGCFIVEASTVNLVSIWFGIAAIPPLILAIFEVNAIVQVIVFALLAAILLSVTKPFVNKIQRGKTIKTNYESIVNKKGTALEDFGSLKTGYVKVAGMDWLATSEEEITKDSTIIVKSVSGAKLKVENID